jgi:hypothetical protein
MNELSFIGAAVVFAAALFGMIAFERTGMDPSMKRIARLGLLLRVVGALAYYALVMSMYGRGDFELYFARGVDIAEQFWANDWSAFADASRWHGGRWWGTQFIIFITALVVSVVGPTMLGTFIVFSFLAFLGLVGFAVAFRRSFPQGPPARYARWIWLLPSLWFWPAAIGKEAVLLLGLGMTVMGYVGRRDKVNWILILCGLGLLSAVRPQMAVVATVSILIAQSLGFGERWTFRRGVQAVMLIALAVLGLSFSLGSLGVTGLDVEEVRGYMEARAASAAVGGSAAEAAGVGWRYAPAALVNILFRPLPWEATNSAMLLAALELALFWFVVACRWRDVVRAVWRWRQHRLTRFGLPFTLLYAASLGMVVVNLGIIARQRIFIFPLLFLFVEAGVVMPRRRVDHVKPDRLQNGGHGAPIVPVTTAALRPGHVA